MSEALVSAYPPARRLDRPLWLLRELLHRLPQVIGSYGSDVVILQRELLSTIPTLEFLTKAPRILDVDDAIWLHRRGIAANSIARRVDHIVCGNQYLADYFGQFGRPTTIIPTGVDTLRFSPRRERRENRVIGWSGTSGGYRFLYDIEIPLSHLFRDHPEWKLRIVSDRPPEFKVIPAEKVEFIRWTETNEVETLPEWISV